MQTGKRNLWDSNLRNSFLHFYEIKIIVYQLILHTYDVHSFRMKRRRIKRKEQKKKEEEERIIPCIKYLLV